MKAPKGTQTRQQPKPPSSRIDAALTLLVKAWHYAASTGQDPWDFAIEIDTLGALGVDHSDLRWMVSRGLIDHAAETAPRGLDTRRFLRTGRFTFTRQTCFILTAQGSREFLVENNGSPAASRPNASVPNQMASAADPGIRPSWDKNARELRLRGVLVKQFQVPARNQELVLDAFEEEGWPSHLDDPLPPSDELLATRRLHNTITRLNQCQTNPLIRFGADGRGLGVRWALHDRVATTSKPVRR